MTDFMVDVEHLLGLGSDLDRARAQLDETLLAMRDVGPATLGTQELDRSCAEFHQAWQHGLGALADCVQRVRTGVEGTAAAYTGTDDALSLAFRAMGDVLGDGGAAR